MERLEPQQGCWRGAYPHEDLHLVHHLVLGQRCPIVLDLLPGFRVPSVVVPGRHQGIAAFREPANRHQAGAKSIVGLRQPEGLQKLVHEAREENDPKGGLDRALLEALLPALCRSPQQLERVLFRQRVHEQHEACVRPVPPHFLLQSERHLCQGAQQVERRLVQLGRVLGGLGLPLVVPPLALSPGTFGFRFGPFLGLLLVGFGSVASRAVPPPSVGRGLPKPGASPAERPRPGSPPSPPPKRGAWP